jgi:hypothetical protein
MDVESLRWGLWEVGKRKHTGVPENLPAGRRETREEAAQVVSVSPCSVRATTRRDAPGSTISMQAISREGHTPTFPRGRLRRGGGNRKPHQLDAVGPSERPGGEPGGCVGRGLLTRIVRMPRINGRPLLQFWLKLFRNHPNTILGIAS